MISDGCIIEEGSVVRDSVLSPGVHVCNNAEINKAIIFTDCIIGKNSKVDCSILDKRVQVGDESIIGEVNDPCLITVLGKQAIIPPGYIIHSGSIIGPDVIPSDYNSNVVKSGEFVQTRRLPYEF